VRRRTRPAELWKRSCPAGLLAHRGPRCAYGVFTGVRRHRVRRHRRFRPCCFRVGAPGRTDRHTPWITKPGTRRWKTTCVPAAVGERHEVTAAIGTQSASTFDGDAPAARLDSSRSGLARGSASGWLVGHPAGAQRTPPQPAEATARRPPLGPRTRSVLVAALRPPVRLSRRTEARDRQGWLRAMTGRDRDGH